MNTGLFFQSAIFELTHNQFLELVPFLVLAAGFAVAVVAAGFKLSPRSMKLSGICIFSIAIAGWSLNVRGDELMLGLHVSKLTHVVGILCSLFAMGAFGLFDVANRYRERPEWLALLVLAVMGLSLLPTSRDWVSFFVFLEFFSIPAYILSGYDVERERSLEASLKYLLTGTFASALLLMGIALAYLSAGSVDYLALSSQMPGGPLSSLAVAFILAGIFFKLTIVPFHFWAPDVYQGAPTGIAAFLAASTKLSVFVAGAIAFHETGFLLRHDAVVFATVAGSLSVIVGSFLAFSQRSFRRMLAYSGTVNAGLLAPLMVAGLTSVGAGVFFLFIYGVTLFVILAALTPLVTQRGLDANDDLEIDSLSRNDSQLRSTETLVITAALFSLAGIPPLPGFIGKYWVLSELWLQGQRGLVIWGLVSTLMGVAYYIRVAGKFFFIDKREVHST